jgi:dipeptidyl aminopeptidase/acylaminoacyl peptidase
MTIPTRGVPVRALVMAAALGAAAHAARPTSETSRSGQAVAAQAPRAADALRPMTLVDLLEVPVLGEPQLSPDGRQLLYTLTSTDWKANRRIPHVWRVNSDGTGAVQLTKGESPVGEFHGRWSPDGTRVAFLTVRPDAPGLQIYLIEAAGGDPRVLTKHPGITPLAGTSAWTIEWTPDGAAIYFVATDPRSEDDTVRARLNDDVFAFEENRRQQHLWRVNVADGAETRITSGDYSVLDFRLSSDGRRIALDRAPSTLGDDAAASEVWVIDADGRNGVQVTRNHVRERDAQLSPDGTRVLFLSDANERLESYYNTNAFLAPVTGGTPDAVLHDPAVELMRAAWAPDGRGVFGVANMGVHSEIVHIDPAAHAMQILTNGNHSIPRAAPGAWSVSASAGRHVFLIDEPARFGEVWTLPLAGGTPAMVTHVYDFIGREFRVPRQEKTTWTAADGVTIEGLVLYPLDYQPGRRYPLVVQAHPGPGESDMFGFWGITNYVQVLSAKGYMILKPNYRGSAGYGNTFLRDMVGNYFRNSHTDVLAGVDHLIAQGLADPDRLAIMGWSAGGHMTNKLITVTGRFKAAASGAGAANWISMFAQTDARTDRDQWFGGTPYQKDAPLQAYLDQSPLKDAWKVKTPTIFFAGENDVRVPMPQAVEMFRALRANGVTTHLYVAPREGHNWRELRHLLTKANVELAWFEKHVMNRTYEDERAPGDPAPKPRTIAR